MTLTIILVASSLSGEVARQNEIDQLRYQLKDLERSHNELLHRQEQFERKQKNYRRPNESDRWIEKFFKELN